MARKPLEQLSPAYRRRLERGEAKGLSRQAARGHKPKEHIIRKERLRERQRQAGLKHAPIPLSSYQRSTIKKFVNVQALRSPGYEETGPVIEHLKLLGWPKFQEIRLIQRQLEKESKTNHKLHMMTLDDLNKIAATHNIPTWLLYYR